MLSKKNLAEDKVSFLDLEKFFKQKLETSPYQYMIVPGFIKTNVMQDILSDYPDIKQGGSFPLPNLKYGANFAKLIAQLNSPEFRHAVEEKFSLDLSNKPTMFTVRGKCRERDGKIHTDTESKIITVLLYMNDGWNNDTGRLRLLNSNNIDDIAAEVPPIAGTLLVFKRSNNSYHGHLPFSGPRKAIQMNWVTHQKFIDREVRRHRWSFILKKFNLSY